MQGRPERYGGGGGGGEFKNLGALPFGAPLKKKNSGKQGTGTGGGTTVFSENKTSQKSFQTLVLDNGATSYLSHRTTHTACVRG